MPLVGGMIETSESRDENMMLLEAITVIISTAIPLSVSFILAGLGEMFNQRAGTFNLGVEGIMLLGAFTGLNAPRNRSMFQL